MPLFRKGKGIDEYGGNDALYSVWRYVQDFLNEVREETYLEDRIYISNTIWED